MGANTAPRASPSKVRPGQGQCSCCRGCSEEFCVAFAIQKGSLSQRLTQNQRELSPHAGMCSSHSTLSSPSCCPSFPRDGKGQQLHKPTPLGQVSVINHCSTHITDLSCLLHLTLLRGTHLLHLCLHLDGSSALFPLVFLALCPLPSPLFIPFWWAQFSKAPFPRFSLLRRAVWRAALTLDHLPKGSSHPKLHPFLQLVQKSSPKSYCSSSGASFSHPLPTGLSIPPSAGPIQPGFASASKTSHYH